MDTIDSCLVQIKNIHDQLKSNPEKHIFTRSVIIKKLELVYENYIQALLQSDEISYASFFTCLDIVNYNIYCLKQRTVALILKN